MCMIEALHKFTCETGTCDISHVYLEHVVCYSILRLNAQFQTLHTFRSVTFFNI
jgi:hypothetical protein